MYKCPIIGSLSLTSDNGFKTGLSFRTYSGNPCKIFFRKIEFSAKIFEFITKFPWVCGNFLDFRKNSPLWRHCCFIGVPKFFRNIEFLKNMLEFFEKIAWVLVFLEFLKAWVFFENAKRQAWFRRSFQFFSWLRFRSGVESLLKAATQGDHLLLLDEINDSLKYHEEEWANSRSEALSF